MHTQTPGFEEVKTAPRNLLKLATSHNLAMNSTSQPHKYQNTRHTMPTHTDLYANGGAPIQLIFWIYITGRLNIHLRGPRCEEVGNPTSQPATTLQHHVLARICPHNCMNVRAHKPKIPVPTSLARTARMSILQIFATYDTQNRTDLTSSVLFFPISVLQMFLEVVVGLMHC